MARSRVRRDLGDLLDCTICLEEPASPIHSCANGHIVCGLCVDKVKKCGFCRMDLTVSYFAERLSRQFRFTLPCRNGKSGCAEVVAAAEIKNHLEETCYFRDIICTEMKSGSCAGTKVPFNEYSKHLQERHKCLIPSFSYLMLPFTKEGLFVHPGLLIPTGILEEHGNTFLLLSQITPDSIYFWMTVLGSKETADKFMFELKVFKILECGNKVQASWTIPVVAFHDRPKYLQGSTYYATVPAKMVKELGSRVKQDNKRQIGFHAWSRVFKKINI